MSDKRTNVRTVSSAVMKLFLKAVANNGASGINVSAPSAAQAVDVVLDRVDKQNQRSKRFRESAAYGGYFNFKPTKKGYVITLTEKGKIAHKDILFEDYEIPRNKKWDGKWHIFMFDVPETHRKLRHELSYKVKDLGMKKLQNSVFVYPYELNSFTQQLRARYPEAMKFVMTARVDKIEGEFQLRNAFRTII
jgi:CRISPR-associated endonuclease Cas2